MIKFFLLVLLIIIFFNIISNKRITSNILHVMRENNSDLNDNDMISFLSGLLNDPLLLNSNAMINCILKFKKNSHDINILESKFSQLSHEMMNLIDSNLYSHLNHKFKNCDFKRDNSQKLSIYFIDKFRNMLREVFFYPIVSQAKSALICYKNETNELFSNTIEEYFLQIEKYALGFPETFCQLKHIEPITLQLKDTFYGQLNRILKFYAFGKNFFREFLRILEQEKRKCINIYSDNNEFLLFSKS